MMEDDELLLDDVFMDEDYNPSLGDELFMEERESEQKVIDDLTAERDEYKNKYLFALADVDNIKKRFNAERPLLIERGEENVLKELLNVIDDFSRAMHHNMSVEDPDKLREGFRMIFDKFMNTVDSFKVSEIDSLGKEFDSDVHEAVSTIPVPENTKGLENTIADVTRTGWTYKDKILRHPQVVVYAKS